MFKTYKIEYQKRSIHGIIDHTVRIIRTITFLDTGENYQKISEVSVYPLLSESVTAYKQLTL